MKLTVLEKSCCGNLSALQKECPRQPCFPAHEGPWSKENNFINLQITILNSVHKEIFGIEPLQSSFSNLCVTLRVRLMEEPVAQQQAADVTGNSGRPRLQKYALRSASKVKEQKPDASDLSNSSASKRVRPAASSVSKSVGVLDLSGKDKSAAAKPLRRFSIPAKAAATPGPKLSGNITPISETRTRRSANGQGRIETPISYISRPSSRTKFNMLSKSSYWLSHIKVSESSAKHSISLGFFKLASEAGCEPLKKMQDELKSYVRRHNLTDLGDPVKELFQSYNITEDNTEQSQVPETISQVPEEGTRSSDDDVHSSSSTMGTGKLKPKCLNIDSTQVSPPARESTKKVTVQKNNAGSRVRVDASKNSSNSMPALENCSRRSLKKSEKPSKKEASKEKGEDMKQGKKSEVEQTSVSHALPEVTNMGNKENMDASLTEERV
ncbi:uncharacterized protein LOC129320304 [Prosopis cineraria]|uniref:uncharacterized protein LOC129320304 n=1 Tax=Prosopis cineraria TaxID=364024 RepID=UPI00240F6A44|nr:uncharacterized protein LOC129320304 [Prosopis cineraria]